MTQRVVTGGIAGAILIGLLAYRLFVGEFLIQIFLFALYMIALHEMIAAFHHKGMRPVRWAVYLSGAILMAAAAWKPDGGALTPALFLCAFISLVASVFQRNPREGDFLATCFTLIYPSIPFLAIFLLSMLPTDLFLPVFVSIFISSIASDVFALLVGVRFGKRQLIPQVSPKKTWEGAIGGLVASTAFVLGYGLLLNAFVGERFYESDVFFLHFIALGIVGSVATQLGDLIGSVIKRYCGVKDFGKLLPGHGGVLDRMDGMILNALMVAVYLSFAMGGFA